MKKIYVTQQQYDHLMNGGVLELNGKQYSYDQNAEYFIKEETNYFINEGGRDNLALSRSYDEGDEFAFNFGQSLYYSADLPDGYSASFQLDPKGLNLSVDGELSISAPNFHINQGVLNCKDIYLDGLSMDEYVLDALDGAPVVKTSGNQNIGGAKTFTGTANFNNAANFAHGANFNGIIKNGYLRGGRINLHPEGNSTTLTYFVNDLTGLFSMGGTCTCTRTDKDGNVLGEPLSEYNRKQWFNGTTSYGALVGGGRWQSATPNSEPAFSKTDIVTIDIDLSAWKTFAWTTAAGIGFGSLEWRAKDIKVETNYIENGTLSTWREVYNVTNSDLETHHFLSPGPSGTSGEKCNRIRITLTNFNSASEVRIAGVWMIGYNSKSLASTLVSRVDGTMMSNLNPEKNGVYYLGIDAKRWYEVNATYFKENGTRLESKYGRLSSNNTWTGSNTFSKDITVLGNSFNSLYQQVQNMYGNYVFFQTDATRAYEKKVPNNALEYANINKLGGMSYVSKNMINNGQEPWKVSLSGGEPIVQLQYTSDTDIRVTALRSASSDSPVWNSATLKFDAKLFDITKKYRLKIDHVVASSTNYPRVIVWAYNDDDSQAVQLTEKNSIRQSESSIDLTINLPAWSDSDKTALQNASYVTLTLYANDQGTCDAGAYVDYNGIYFGEYDVLEEEMVMFDGVRHSPVQQIQSSSSNLFNLTNGTRTDNGYAIRCLDGEIYFSGQAKYGTANMVFDVSLPAGTYSISLFNNIKGSAANTVFGVKTSHWENAYKCKSTSGENATYTFTCHTPIIGFFIGGITDNMDLTGFSCRPMIVEGPTPAVEYEKHSFCADVREIPEELRNLLPGYGLGVNDQYYNYLDFENRQYIQNCASFHIDGTEGHISLYKDKTDKGQDTGFYRFQIGATAQKIWDVAASNTINANVVQDSGIPAYSVWSDYDNLRYEQVSIQSWSFFITIDKNKASTVEELRAWLGEHPINGVYTFDAPVKISFNDLGDLMAGFDDSIYVIENGTLTFMNTENQSVPSEIEYQVAGVDN